MTSGCDVATSTVNAWKVSGASTPACDQLLVNGPEGRWFLPARDDVLVQVDAGTRTLWVELPPGLLDAGEGEA